MKNVSTTVDVKIANAVKIYTQLRGNTGFSKSQLAQAVHLSFASVSNMCTALEEEGLLKVTNNIRSTGGRKAAKVTFNADFAHTLVIDMHHTQHIYLAIVNLENTIIESTRFEVIPSDSLDIILDNIHRYSSDLMRKTKYNILGVCVGISAVFNPKTKTLLQSSNPVFERVNLLTYLADLFPNKKILVENDANLAALSQTGLGETCRKNILFIFFTQGIGLGILINGNLYMGTNGFAGELGHLKVTGGTKKCKCGALGCLRTVATLESIAQDLGETTLLSSLPSSVLYTTSLAERYSKNETAVVNRVNFAAEKMGEVMSELFDLFNPEEIVLGGNMGALFPYIKNTIREHSRELSNLSREVDLQIRFIDLKTFELIQKGGGEKMFQYWMEHGFPNNIELI